MLSLDSQRWSELTHAYGVATDIPALLGQLEELPDAVDKAEPWYSLWSALAHQGDVYPASFAAVPHVVSAIAKAPSRASGTYFHFPAWVEICRQKKQVSIPDDLHLAYFNAHQRLPSLVAAAAGREWDEDFLLCALAALATSKGQPIIAEAVLELTAEVSAEFLEWFFER